MGVSKNNGTPKSSILIGFSIIFTIHFGVPLFLETSLTMFRFKYNGLKGVPGPLGELSQADEIACNALISTFEKAATWRSEIGKMSAILIYGRKNRN